jgi:glycosyltransferase involved in cell wall biosynthesis
MREAIDSALAQTYENIEVIVINDGSWDQGETDRIAKEYGEKIRYIHKENGGVSTALNTGIQNMRGEYFSWLSHDDVYMPDKVEKQVKALSEIQDKTAVVCCGSVHIDKNSKLMGPVAQVDVQDVKLLSWDAALMDLLKNGSMNGCALLIKKTIFEDVGLFDETLRFNQDGFMWSKIFLNRYALLRIPDICVKGRIHDKQLTQTAQELFRSDCEKMSIYMIPEMMKVSTPDRNFILAYILYNAKYGNAGVVKQAYAEAKTARLLTFKNRIAVTLLYGYGMIRPMIRKMYYLVFRGINTR